MITIDFETRSELDVTKVGPWKYSKDPSTEVLCMAYRLHDGPVHTWEPGQPMPHALGRALEEDMPVEAHNAMFEYCIWNHVFRNQVVGWRSIKPEQFYCSAAKAASFALPRALGDAVNALGLSEHKDKEGHKIMMKFTQPQKITKKNKEKWYWDDIDFIKLKNYCKQDVVAEHGLSQRLRPLTDYERQVWLLDQKINRRGIRVDIESVNAAIALSEEYAGIINAELPDLTGGKITKATQRQRIVDFCQENGMPHVQSLSKDSVEEYLKEDNVPDDVRQVLTIRLKLAKSSVSKYRKMIVAACDDDRLRDLLMYWGAHTGRWAGKTVQPHNMPKNRFKGNLDKFHDFLKICTLDQFELVYENVMEVLSMTIRSFLIPSEGKLMFGGDFAAIEARVVMWCAGDEQALEGFRQGLDMYKVVAGMRFGVPYEEVTDEQRALGKVIILACGFQMGPGRFFETCEEWGVPCTEDEAKQAVAFYRDRYPKVVQLWREQEATAMLAVRQPGKFFRCGKIGWMVHDGFLHCKLPSGRLLSYYDPIIKVKTNTTKDGRTWTKETISYMTVDSKTKKWVRDYTYGGKLTENFVQAIARDLMVQGALNCEEAGYDVLLSVHDELITENYPKIGMVEEFEKLMCAAPEWAHDLPIKVEGWKGNRYLK